ncbi:family 16 glycoside hydrolase [Salinibacter sp. 10B]|uniref:family 16 glycoside hydrolase n=1 Tax=Salinibacter sp. 10B TaxID=1923971 RepID=UPI0015E2BEC5|nr:family 16 glycoside hydrolase [Salinibacter sp. 10B]
MLRHFLCVLGVFCLGMGGAVQAQFQGLPPTALPLEDLQSFRSAPENWSVADSAWADPTRERHLESTRGSGVLVNASAKTAAEPLLTRWTHQDLEIEMDVMMSRGARAGIFLQGRYEIQLVDSWGVQEPTDSDMGAISQPWRSRRPEGERGVGGHPPRANVAKAPGLWQHLTIDFQAPRFNEDGEKVAPAQFNKVALNGVVIHRNISLRGPTRDARFEAEARTGPLMIVGDQGPVAIKNIRYKRYRPGEIFLSGLTYRRYDASLARGLGALDPDSLVEERATDRISQEVVGEEDDFAAEFEGTLTVPRSGTYGFDLRLDWIRTDASSGHERSGGGRLRIDGERVLAHAGSSRSETGTVDLEEGAHSFRLVYFKNREYTSNSQVGLFVEGPNLRRRSLTTDRVPAEVQDPIHVAPTTRPTLLRSFFRHEGEKKTHVLSVGSPAGGHYAYDLVQGSLLQVWRGPFLRANPMWEGRGHAQRAVPRGSGPVLSDAPPLAILSDRSAPWPDSMQQRVDHEYQGYRLDAQGRPTFRHRFGNLNVTDQLRGKGTGQGVERTLMWSGTPSSEKIYIRLLRAEALHRAGPNRFVGGDRELYLELKTGGEAAFLRRREGKRELLVPLTTDDASGRLRYEIIW